MIPSAPTDPRLGLHRSTGWRWSAGGPGNQSGWTGCGLDGLRGRWVLDRIQSSDCSETKIMIAHLATDKLGFGALLPILPDPVLV